MASAELKKKIKIALGNDFIGLTEFTDEEIDEMCNDCIETLNSIDGAKTAKKFMGNERIGRYGEFVVCLVNITKQIMCSPEFSENRLLPVALPKIFKSKTSLQTNVVYDILTEVFDSIDKPIFKNETENCYRETILAQALMPYKSLYDFIEILKGWYTNRDLLNFRYNEKYLEAMYDSLYNAFSNDKSTENFLFSGKTYKIKMPIRYIFLQDKEAAKSLINLILHSIDKFYNSDKLDVKNNYIEKIIYDVLKDTNIKEQKGSRYKDIVVDGFENLKVEYRYKDNDITLFVPMIELPAGSKFNIKYELYYKNNHFKNIKKLIYGNNFISTIREESITIPEDKTDGLNLKIRNTDTNEILFDSKELLFKKHLIFNDNGKLVLKKILAPGHYYLFSNYITNETIDERDGNSIFMVEDDFIKFEDDEIRFSEKQNLYYKIAGKNNFKNVKDIKYISKNDNTEYEFYTNVNSIEFSAKEINDIAIYIDAEKIPNEKIENVEDDYYSINLSDYNVNGTHSIIFYDKDNNKIEGAYFYVANDFDILKWDRKILSDNDEMFIYNLNGNENQILVSPETEDLKIDTGNGEIVLELFYVKWKFSFEKEFYYTGLDKHFYYKNEFFPNNWEINVRSNIDKEITLKLNKVEVKCVNNNFIFDNILNKIDCDKKVKLDFVFVIKFQNYELFSLYNKPFISGKFNLNFKDKTFDREKYYVGRNDDKIVITIPASSKREEKKIIINSDNNFDIELNSGIYTGVLVEVFDNFDKLIYSKVFDKKEIGNMNKLRFLNKILMIKYHNCMPGLKIISKPSEIKNIKYRGEKENGIYQHVYYKGTNKNNEEVLFDLDIPKDASYNYKINFPINLRMWDNDDNVCIDDENENVVCFYDNNKENLNNNYSYTIISANKTIITTNLKNSKKYQKEGR